MMADNDAKIAALQRKLLAMDGTLVQLASVLVQTQSLLLAIKSHIPAALADEQTNKDVDELFARTDELVKRLRASTEALL